MSVLLWLGLAHAADAPEDEPTAAEVVVYSEHLIERARNEVVQTLAKEGYSLVKEREGYTVLAHRNTYRGQVRLYDDGRMEVRRQGFKFGPHRNELLERNKPLAWLVCFCSSSNYRNHLAHADCYGHQPNPTCIGDRRTTLDRCCFLVQVHHR